MNKKKEPKEGETKKKREMKRRIEIQISVSKYDSSIMGIKYDAFL